MNLYDINEELMSLVDEEGEISDYEQFEALAMQRDEKIENIACYIKNLRSDASELKAEIDRLTKRKKIIENKAENLFNYLQSVLNGAKFETAKAKISYITSKTLEIEEGFVRWAETNAPDLITYSAPKVDKNAVKTMIAMGEDVPHVYFAEHLNMQIK